MILHWHDETFECDRAVKNDSEVLLYDENNKLIRKIFGISVQEWNYIWLESGNWSDSSEIPTKEEYLQADIDFLTMENESIESDLEQARADLDYCLMLLEG